MKASILATIPLLPFALAGCGTAEDPQPLPEEATLPPVASGDGTVNPANIPAGVYSVDRSHTYLTFSYLHLGYSYPLMRFTSIDGELNLNGNVMEESTVAISIDTNSLDTKLPRFDAELQSLQYFNADDFPKITFTSHTYEPTGDTGAKITGYLTIKGRTRPASLDVTINNAIQHPMLDLPVIGFSATGTLLRSDWGLSRNIPFVADEVNVRIEIEFLQGSNELSREAAGIAIEATAAAPMEDRILPGAGA